jgi:hypothetical protein
MEALRINGQTPSVTFTGLLPSSEYTLTYTDLSTQEEYTSTQQSNASGEVSFVLNSYYDNYDGVLDATLFNYLDEVENVAGIEVVRPYTNITTLATELDKTYNQARDTERTARFIIDSESAKTFGFVRKEKEFIGNGSDYLVIDEKIHKLYKVYENGNLLYDSTQENNVVTYTISKDKTSIIPVYIEANKSEYPQVWRDRYLSRAFADGYDYVVEADFGYKVIPQDIQEATKLLCSDISSGNMQYINNYIESFDNADFKIKFAKNFANGTGNLIVDKILSKYKNSIKIGVL